MTLMKKTILSCCIYFILFSSPSFADDIDYSDSFNLDTLETASEISKEPVINSRAAIVIEKSTGAILYAKNENQQRKMASTTKIMTAIVVLEQVSDLSEMVEISKRAAGIGGSRLGLSTSSKITVNDLLYGLLLCSGNDSAIALAEFVGGSVEGFADLMNQKALSLGLSNTHFITPHGLDNDEHYTTAHELAILTQYALRNETFCKIVGTKTCTVHINGSPKNIGNTNELLGYLNGVYGVKTGFTNGANRCLVSSCKRGDLDVICLVLGADTKKNRTQDSIKLLEYVFANYEMVDVKSMIDENFNKWQSEYSNRFYINKGTSNFLETTLEELPFSKYPINKSNINDINISINCDYIYEAPLLEKSNIGFLDFSIGDDSIFNLALHSSKTIERKNIFSYLADFFLNYRNYLETIFNI